eukprot:8348402-Pyramimonas_sp.AAC.1
MAAHAPSPSVGYAPPLLHTGQSAPPPFRSRSRRRSALIHTSWPQFTGTRLVFAPSQLCCLVAGGGKREYCRLPRSAVRR